MSGKKLNKIGGFLRYWKNAIIYCGYNTKMIPCFYIVRGTITREIPYSWEYIMDCGSIIDAWDSMKLFLVNNRYSLAYDAKSDQTVHYGMIE